MKHTSLTPSDLEIEYLSIDTLQANPKNARTHSDKQVQQIASSIAKFGFINPVIIDDEHNLLCGHGRVEGAKRIGLNEVPAVRISSMSEDDKRAYILADNRLAELAGWDMDIVSRELEYLMDADFDFTITGFEISDIDFSSDTSNDDRTEETETVELPDPAAQAINQPGDLWHIGPHRLICGNSLEASVWDRLLDGERAQMMFSDPPYNVPISGHVSGLGKVQHREFNMASGEMNQVEFTAFLRKIFRLCVQNSEDGSIHYHCMDWRHVRELLDASDGIYADWKNMICWVKENAGMGSFYRSQHELIFAFKSGKSKHINNFGLGEGGRYRTNVWRYAGANGFYKGREEDLKAHSTVKPIAMVADAILDCSSKGGLIVDPFAGSGTTLLAAHRTGRVGASIEIDPLYADTALRRLGKASSLQPIHADGRKFLEIEDERRQIREKESA